MAPLAQIAEALPTTLPADFGEWDEKRGSSQPAEVAPAQPSPQLSFQPRTAEVPAPHPEPAAHLEPPRNRQAVPPQKVYSREKSFLDQLISMRPEADASGRTSAQAAISPGAIYEVALPRPRTKSWTESRTDSRTDASAARANRARVEVGTGKPAPRSATAAPKIANPHESLRPQPSKLAAGKAAEAAPSALLMEASAGKKKIIVALVAGSVSVLVLLLLLAYAVGHHKSGAHPAPPRSAPQAAYSPAFSPVDAKPSPAAPLNAPPLQAANAPQPAPAADAAQDPSPAQDPAPPQVQSQMMNDQLSAPAKITPEMKSKPPEDAPPATLDATGLSGSASPGGVLSGQAAPRVQAALPKIINVSAGIAGGLLIRNAPPIYPTIAKAARVSGTVVLAATISKAGAIETLRVVSGPQMLRQSALDAVRTWRYKPYKVNNQPTDIETTISVVFALQG
jgi:periplasmic protein TonB